MIGRDLRKRLSARMERLFSEQSSWRAHWQELNDYIMPRRFRYLTSDYNKGSKRNDKIINLEPIKAARTLSSGMMAGLTSPARPWFRLVLPSFGLTVNKAVEMWLYDVEKRIREVFARSNIYNALPMVYTDLGVFGTGCMLVEEDDEDVVRAYVFPVGQYALANSRRLAVDTAFRKFSMTVRQLVDEFGLRDADNDSGVSPKVADEYKRGNFDTPIEVCHAICPNEDYNPDREDVLGKPFASYWWEKASADTAGFLRVGGFAEFPIMAPRWNVTGEDVYGYSPGMDVLGDAKALQHYERRKLQLADKVVSPPMVGPTAMGNKRISLQPSELILVDSFTGGTQFKPAQETPYQGVQVFDEIAQQHGRRVGEGFYADLWLMLTTSDRREITAREVDERHEEKMLQLGPVIDRLHDELLDPLIDRVFGIMLRNGLLPEPPPEIQGETIRVEYISIMAQAQKLLHTTGIERLAGFVGNLYAVAPEVKRRVNFDRMVVNYAELLNVPPDSVKSDEEVEEEAEQDAQMQQAQAAAQMAPAVNQTAQAAQVLSQTDTSRDSALGGLLGQFGAPVA